MTRGWTIVATRWLLQALSVRSTAYPMDRTLHHGSLLAGRWTYLLSTMLLRRICQRGGEFL